MKPPDDPEFDWSAFAADPAAIDRLVRRATAPPAARRRRWAMLALPLGAVLAVALLLLARPPVRAVHRPAAFSIYNEGDLFVIHTPAGETWVMHAGKAAPHPGSIFIHVGEMK
jgi:hypothetical protein